jgi:hypothetical protein
MSSSPRSIHRWCPHATALLALSGCSGTDVGYPRVSDAAQCPDVLAPSAGTGAQSGSGATVTAGTGTGGGASQGGSGSGGSDGPPLGGAGSSSAGAPTTGGAAPTTPFEWPAAFDGAASPTPGDGHHNPGSGCMLSSCHGTKVPFVFGGTVYQADGVTGAPNVEVGISDGAQTITAYSASNGNIWLPASAGTIDFTAARIAIRSANGEHVKPATAGRGASCNGGGCHGSTMRLLAP